MGGMINFNTFAEMWGRFPSTFTANLWNFENVVARQATLVFKKSFDLKRFNASGSTPWAQRKRRAKHPLMYETGTLKNSIHSKVDRGGAQNQIKTFSDPSKFGTAARHKGYYYAPWHNAPSGTYSGGWGNQPNVQRQFIGDGAMGSVLKTYSKKLFENMPR